MLASSALTALLAGLAGLVLLPVAAVATLYATLSSEAGTAWLLPRLPGVELQSPQGALLGPRFAAKRLRWTWSGGAAELVVEDLSWEGAQWRWWVGADVWAGVRLQALQAREVRVRTAPAQGPSSLPRSLALPIALEVPAIALGTVRVDAWQPVRNLRAAVHLQAGSGEARGARVQHRIEGLTFQWDKTEARDGRALRTILEAPIAQSGMPVLAPEKGRLNVWLMVGVNGVGKTTTLGKLANLAVRSGYSCLIAAADTFRAAAVQQVQVWGERSAVPVIANPSANADPAAVVYDAIGAAQAHGTELVLVDTAGRLQTKHNLMEELAKVRRIVDKLAPEAVVQSLLVLDASQGQNGLNQAMAFASAAGLTGVVITKLDGSARGGVALAVASETGLPIRFIGAGEGIRDLRPFNSFEFVEALLAS